MADRKISDLTALTTPASGDYLPIVDISEGAAASKNKRVTIQSLFQGIPVNVGIGTSSPGANLAIRSNRAVNTHAFTVGTANGASFENDVVFAFDGSTQFIGNFQNFPLAFTTNNIERVRLDSSGRLLVGTSTAITSLVGYIPSFQVQSSTTINASASITNTSSDAFSGGLLIAKARGTSVVQNNDGLGQLRFGGYDGSAYIESVRIFAEVDGTPGTNDMPGRLVFSTTADGAASPTERMRITSAGLVGIGTTSPQAKFVVSDAGANGIEISPAGGSSLIQSFNRSTSAYTILNYAAIQHVFTNGSSERARIDASGRVGIGTTSPTTLLDVNADTVRVRTARTPASASATGATGEICWDANYIYVAVGTNTWKRAALSTW